MAVSSCAFVSNTSVLPSTTYTVRRSSLSSCPLHITPLISRPRVRPIFITLAQISDAAVPKIDKVSGALTISTPDNLAPLATQSRRLPRIYRNVIIITAFLLVSLTISLIRRRSKLRHLSRPYVRRNLWSDIAQFYDLQSAAWEYVWGEHMHHGLYDTVNGKRLTGVQAQIQTMSELLALAGESLHSLPHNMRAIDVGCGIGGASRFLARTFQHLDCRVTSITLSGFQANRAIELNNEMGLSDKIDVQVRNAMQTGFESDTFDLLWSLESAEHMDDKREFISECARILKPGGKLLMVAWCIRETNTPLSIREQFSVRKIMENYCLPRVAPASEYKTEMIRAGLKNVHVEDWTDRASPFWREVAISATLNVRGWQALRRYGLPTIRSALAMRHIMSGIAQGVFRLVAFSATLPTAAELSAANEKDLLLSC